MLRDLQFFFILFYLTGKIFKVNKKRPVETNLKLLHLIILVVGFFFFIK